MLNVKIKLAARNDYRKIFTIILTNLSLGCRHRPKTNITMGITKHSSSDASTRRENMEMKAKQLPQKLTWGNVTNAKTTASNLKLERIAIMQCSIVRRQKTAFREAEFYCPECGKLFTSKSALNHHKKKENHQAKKQDPPEKKRKTKQRTINDMLRQHASAQNEEDDDQENEPCQSVNCIIDEGSDALILWISCEKCESWYHNVYIGLGHKTQAEFAEIEYRAWHFEFGWHP